MDTPKTMRAWQYGKITNGIENALKLNDNAAVPTAKANQHLIKISYVSLNPVDHKPVENPIMRRFGAPNPATPGVDISGIVIKPAEGTSFNAGDKVFGAGVSPFAGGGLADYVAVPFDHIVKVPANVSLQDASTVPVAGLTAYQTILPTKPKKVFLNGGSGGVGTYGIQIAKASGIEVTVTCSTRNVELCKSLGADEVDDYTKGPVAEALEGKQFDLVVDNVGSDFDLYYKSHKFTTPQAKFISIAGKPSAGFFFGSLKAKLLPGFLGGGKRVFEGFFAQKSPSDLEQIGKWMSEGKVKAVIDSKFAFEDAPKAFEKLKTGRARGKIVVEVNPEN